MPGAANAALTPGAAAASPSAAPSPPAKTSPEPAIPPLTFSLAAFDAALATSSPHRHLFASTKIDGGEVFGAMRGTLKAYADIGVAASDVRPVAALYHGASIALAFDDAMWNVYFLPANEKDDPAHAEIHKDFESVIDSKKKGNPCLHREGGEYDSSIEALVADAGAHFFVCNNAARGFAGMLAHRTGKSEVEVYKELAAHLVPNAMLVPAGVWAVHAIQERHYTLLQTSL